ncbi:hypothetical protein [Streptomyces sp. HB2AG]|uniref:hypothetical protein n=1 Tax=Streptomyces sp. HB2AG TaxID=2983400 RepID=UPI0022AA6AFB|nr:hypothetical protein [Streptomyces sp. HB2AG]MCZ2527962.1 hypothetical protein [Streptomyces sp. HB2AG]
MRRTVLAVTAALLVAEAAGFALVNYVMGVMVDYQQMSLAGMDPAAASKGAWAGAVLTALYFLSCALVLVVAAVRDRAPGRFGRVLLISAAVVTAVVGAAGAALVGWAAFGVMMLLLCAQVLSLVVLGERGDAERGDAERDDSGRGDGDGSPDGTVPGTGPLSPNLEAPQGSA